jgi:hypothetical protein
MIRMVNMSRAFHCALLAAIFLCPFAVAHAQAKPGGARAYWCKSPNGAPAMQLESCAPGTEVRSEPLGPHGSVGVKQPVEPGAVPTAAAAAAERSAPAAAGRGVTAAGNTMTAPRKLPGGSAVKTGLLWLVILLGLGLVAGLIGRQLGRSFWRSAGVGGLLWVALVGLKLMRP